jgi:hypothetical protein
MLERVGKCRKVESPVVIKLLTLRLLSRVASCQPVDLVRRRLFPARPCPGNRVIRTVDPRSFFLRTTAQERTATLTRRVTGFAGRRSSPAPSVIASNSWVAPAPWLLATGVTVVHRTKPPYDCRSDQEVPFHDIRGVGTRVPLPDSCG